MAQLFSNYTDIERSLVESGAKRWMVVCGSSIRKLPIYEALISLPERHVISLSFFSDFSPNPSSISVENGIDYFHQHDCDAIIAVGGGSAIDVAKCVRYFANVTERPLTLKEREEPAHVPLYVIPTTAGSGSEATRFAVIYVDGVKRSVDHESLLPDAILLDGRLLATLPEYQKKSTMLDALCHATESIWCVNATKESDRYAANAIRLILQHSKPYLDGDSEAATAILQAAYAAGQAINISRTTAGHAMAYKLTTSYGFAHGHAVALCVSVLWPHMLESTETALSTKMQRLANAYGVDHPAEAVFKYCDLLKKMQLPRLPDISDADFEQLANSVDPQRLANHPEALTTEMITGFYRKIKAQEN